MKKILDSAWLRAVQFECYTSAKSSKSVAPVQKSFKTFFHKVKTNRVECLILWADLNSAGEFFWSENFIKGIVSKETVVLRRWGVVHKNLCSFYIIN